MQMPQEGSPIKVFVINDTPVLRSLFPDTPNAVAYEGTVLKSLEWDEPKTFRMTGDVNCPIRVIAMHNVITFEGSSVEVVDLSNDRTVVVKGSKGNEYVVTVKANGNATCDCPAAMYRKMVCKHIQQVKEQLC